MVDNGRIKNCAVCGTSLEHLDDEETLACYFCGEEFKATAWCPEGHYVCQTCNNKPLSDFLEEMIRTSRSKNPFEIAELVLGYPSLKQRTCEHAWILTIATLIAAKNEGTIRLTEENLLTALETVRQRANNEHADKVGVCSLLPAVAVAFHTIFHAIHGNALRDDTTMNVVQQAIGHLTENLTRCVCCKNAMLTTLALVTSLIKARFDIELDGSAEEIICNQAGNHDKCQPTACQYSAFLNS